MSCLQCFPKWAILPPEVAGRIKEPIAAGTIEGNYFFLFHDIQGMLSNFSLKKGECGRSDKFWSLCSR